jgi:hypothetical protein
MKATPVLILPWLAGCLCFGSGVASGQQMLGSMATGDPVGPSPALQSVSPVTVTTGTPVQPTALVTIGSSGEIGRQSLSKMPGPKQVDLQVSPELSRTVKSSPLSTSSTSSWSDNRGTWKSDAFSPMCMVQAKSGINTDPCY